MLSEHLENNIGNRKSLQIEYNPVDCGDDEILIGIPNSLSEKLRLYLTKSIFSCFVLVLILALGWKIESQYRRSIEKPTLRYRKEEDDSWVFKVLQITDIHLGEAEDLPWGPENDLKTLVALDAIISKESPDLIVLSGDQLTANNCLKNATSYYQLLGDFLIQYETPWAIIFGNHDDMDFEIPGTNNTIPHKYSRRQLLEVDKSYQLSLSQGGPLNVTGTTNYVLDIHIQGNNIATQIFFLDSGGGSLREAIDDSQIQWIREVVSTSEVPAIAFQHIWPSIEHFKHCQGYQGEGIAPLEYDAGIMQTLAESGRFSFIAVGHNHGNDYCCQYLETELKACFGRHSGYGGYGRWDRGSRIYELRIPPTIKNTLPSLKWRTWVRLESGEIIDEIIQNNLNNSQS